LRDIRLSIASRNLDCFRFEKYADKMSAGAEAVLFFNWSDTIQTLTSTPAFHPETCRYKIDENWHCMLQAAGFGCLFE
jgi:hypothetical protein